MRSATGLYVSVLLFQTATIGPVVLIALLSSLTACAIIPPLQRWAAMPEGITP